MLETSALDVRVLNVKCVLDVKDQSVECKRPEYWVQKRI